MTDIPEAGRQVAHVYLDAVAAWDPELSTAGDRNSDAMDLALRRMNEIEDAIVVKEVADGVSLDLSNTHGGTIVLVNWLVHRLAEARDEPPELIIARAREFLDG